MFFSLIWCHAIDLNDILLDRFIILIFKLFVSGFIANQQLISKLKKQPETLTLTLVTKNQVLARFNNSQFRTYVEKAMWSRSRIQKTEWSFDQVLETKKYRSG